MDQIVKDCSMWHKFCPRGPGSWVSLSVVILGRRGNRDDINYWAGKEEAEINWHSAMGTEILKLFMRQARRRKQQFEILHLISTSGSFSSLPHQEVTDVSVNSVPSKEGPYPRSCQWMCRCWSSSCEVPACITSPKAKCRWGHQQWGVREAAQSWDTHTLN